MRVAVAKRKKELTFISSVGVVGGLDHPQPVMESEDGPALCDVHPGDGGYAIGCAYMIRRRQQCDSETFIAVACLQYEGSRLSWNNPFGSILWRAVCMPVLCPFRCCITSPSSLHKSMKVLCVSFSCVRTAGGSLGGPPDNSADLCAVFGGARYGCSKWACEVLLKQLHERCGIPVKIFRCGMILSHTQYLGQINPTDFFTRLLCGIAYTGIAPESFYTLPHGPEEHFDGMPIDFVSGDLVSSIWYFRDCFLLSHWM